MPIPDYQTLVLPVLKQAANREARVRDVTELMADQFDLSPDERQKRLPSDTMTVIGNRTWWAKTYLQKAGLVRSTRRGYFEITPRGKEVLSQSPARIDNALLKQFEEFRAFQAPQRLAGEGGAAAADPPEPSDAETPNELLRRVMQQFNEALSKELLERLVAATPSFFEHVVVQLLRGMGYGGDREDAGKVIGRSGDGGLDGVIDQDQLGLDRVYIQAKCYALENPVSEPDIRNFAGGLGAAKADKGVFVTTSYFTGPAVAFAARHPAKIVLIDGERLARLMVQFGIGVRTEETLLIRKIDEDFFLND